MYTYSFFKVYYSDNVALYSENIIQLNVILCISLNNYYYIA